MSPLASRTEGKYLNIYMDDHQKELIRVESAHSGASSMSEFCRLILVKYAQTHRKARLKAAKDSEERVLKDPFAT